MNRKSYSMVKVTDAKPYQMTFQSGSEGMNC